MRISDWSSDVCSSDLSSGSRSRPPRRALNLAGRISVRSCMRSAIRITKRFEAHSKSSPAFRQSITEISMRSWRTTSVRLTMPCRNRSCSLAPGLFRVGRYGFSGRCFPGLFLFAQHHKLVYHNLGDEMFTPLLIHKIPGDELSFYGKLFSFLQIFFSDLRMLCPEDQAVPLRVGDLFPVG